jgi:hypothetical protein
MLDSDLPLTVIKVSHESMYQEDGTTRKDLLYRFKLGKFGPFTERILANDPNPRAFEDCVDKLRRHLVQIHS